jgi:hypothetical protein
MSQYNELILGLVIGGTLLWWWKTSENENKLKQKQQIENLAISLNFNEIKILSTTDFALLISLLPHEKRLEIIEQKRRYEFEIEENARQVRLERERINILLDMMHN